MYQITVKDERGRIVSMLEEEDYESFIVKCYNFREDQSLDLLQVFHVSNEKRHLIRTETLHEMIETWLDPGFLFTMGYPLQF
ncbi:hypothetical protein DSL64_18690 [Dyadobacter luteus]|uniref:Uncharacterized protein n=1 Tax=Dyadobacter luteus TaxID=2259619 RepID=A0A3D8Y7I3_9BACT|nr:hypothetical protein [Dyadobacter luteus]REA58991.1 hypothetical protein DSL64_18690 [Dyadobacter luteus]